MRDLRTGGLPPQDERVALQHHARHGRPSDPERALPPAGEGSRGQPHQEMDQRRRLEVV